MEYLKRVADKLLELRLETFGGDRCEEEFGV